jgi:hypothetical protein
VCHMRQLTPDVREGWEILLGGDEQRRLGILEDVSPLRRRQPVIERDGDDASFGGGEVEKDLLQSIFREDRHAIADLESSVDQRVGQLVNLAQRLMVGDASVTVDGKLCGRSLTSLIVEHVMQPHVPFPPLIRIVLLLGLAS